MAEKFRRVGVADGDDEYTEHLVRTIYPDGTVVDAPAQRGLGDDIEDPAQGVARVFGRQLRVVRMVRTIRTHATPWREYDLDAPANEPAVDTVQEVTALDHAMHVVWLHTNWTAVTRAMTNRERAAAADAVERVQRSLGVHTVNAGLRWWSE